MYNTPPLRYRNSSIPSSATPSTPTGYNRTLDSRRRALGDGGARDRGTPVGRLLRDEGMVGIRSPRKIKVSSWTEKVQDWPSNFIMSIETSISLLEFDSLGYPLAIGLNGIHLLTRFSVFAAKIPNWRDVIRIGDRIGDADARLEYMRKQATGDGSNWKAATILSLLLVILSIVNSVYLYTRKRRYHLILRQDPLSSPNARTSRLDFSPPKPKSSLYTSLKRKALNYIWRTKESEGKVYQVQQLDVWTPDYVVWSLRLFSLYPPPISIMYHFLTPSNFIPLLICGSLLVFQNLLLVKSFTQLLADRQTLQAEVMHEYNTRFVNPRIFVQKRDFGTSTNEAEIVGFRSESWKMSGGSGKIRNGASGRPSTSQRGFVAQVDDPQQGEVEEDQDDEDETEGSQDELDDEEEEGEEDEVEEEEEDEEEIERERLRLEAERLKMKKVMELAKQKQSSPFASSSRASPCKTVDASTSSRRR